MDVFMNLGALVNSAIGSNFLTFRCNDVYGAPSIHLGIDLFGGKITYSGGFGQGGSEHWKIHI